MQDQQAKDSRMKYELREGEEFIDEYIEDDGTHFTILKDKNGEIKHGFTIDIDADIFATIEHAANIKGISVEDFIDESVEHAILLIIEEEGKRNFIEEVST